VTAVVAGEGRAVAPFVFPFRPGGRASRWLIGSLLMALLPVSFVIVFGYAVACVRTAAADPFAAPPPWRPGVRLLSDGAWSAVQVAVLTAPFALAAWLAADVLARVWHPAGHAVFDRAYALIVTGVLAALPWGISMLVLVPPTLTRFALSGRARALADVRWALSCVRWRYAEWNLAVVAITTGWLLGLVCVVGFGFAVVPGAFYAILVSAHACAALAPDRTAR
jgi:hypothetical protein